MAVPDIAAFVFLFIKIDFPKGAVFLGAVKQNKGYIFRMAGKDGKVYSPSGYDRTQRQRFSGFYHICGHGVILA
jgi:hypothetical protein